MIPLPLAALCVATIFLAGTPPASAAALYTLSFLPTGFYGAQLNDAGQVVGTASGAAALYSYGALTSVAPSPSIGQGINNQGHIAGSMKVNSADEAFFYAGSTLTSLDPVLGGSIVESNGMAINDSGVVGGNLYRGGENNRGFLYDHGTVEHIGTFGGDYSPLAAINRAGAATGYAAFDGPAGGYYHAYIYQDGNLQDIGTLDGFGPDTYSAGSDINNLGQVVGWSGSFPFLYSGGSMTNLGALGDYGGAARALNDEGVIVGSSYSRLTPGGTVAHAFLYASDTMVDLNTLVAVPLGWELTDARDINAAGQILGSACQNGTCVSVLMTPVPEPAVSLMFLAALGALAIRKTATVFRGALKA